jgi:hypothetical protein
MSNKWGSSHTRLLVYPLAYILDALLYSGKASGWFSILSLNSLRHINGSLTSEDIYLAVIGSLVHVVCIPCQLEGICSTSISNGAMK